MPGGLVQSQGARIATRQLLDGKDLPQGKVVVAALKTYFQLQAATSDALDDGQLGTVSNDPNQVPNLWRWSTGVADGRGQLSLRDLQTEAGRRSWPA